MKTILDIMSIFAPSNAQALKDIRLLTDFLLLQQQQYRPISNNYLTYNFYETKKTRLLGGSSALLVPQISAVPPTASKSQQIEMPTDHIGIAKLLGQPDCTFERVVKPLEHIANTSQTSCQHRWDKFKGEVQSHSVEYSQLTVW
jgi:hypothetical protein